MGEYGDQGGRPHYHAILFGYPPCIYGRTRYIGRGKARRFACCGDCELILNTWGKGFVEVGPCNSDTVQYVTGYVTKKMTSSKDKRLNGRPPEFVLMSRGRRPNGGLGFPMPVSYLLIGIYGLLRLTGKIGRWIGTCVKRF